MLWLKTTARRPTVLRHGKTQCTRLPGGLWRRGTPHQRQRGGCGGLLSQPRVLHPRQLSHATRKHRHVTPVPPAWHGSHSCQIPRRTLPIPASLMPQLAHHCFASSSLSTQLSHTPPPFLSRLARTQPPSISIMTSPPTHPSAEDNNNDAMHWDTVGDVDDYKDVANTSGPRLHLR